MNRNYFVAALFIIGAAMAPSRAHAEILKGERIVGHYDCGTMICNFETPDAGTFDFEVADEKVAPKIFDACKIGDICAITGDFDIDDAVIVNVIEVENSGQKNQD
ncbi:hypothetical protein [Stenotrophomonas sp. CFBP 13725]|uniref:hypothetical protein n=1 Tax=Stenotrophomonas sp. CFBP 13725 TaxID=2775297 RepID=UPI00177C42BB|nr:hypothetical protein [Stenotrophomonas sp. CFBP 13725]MBD8636601.1 hypothetical protein [Stenotrophomonas sp. CFBP 13725]